MCQVRLIYPDEPHTLRALRLSALRDSPQAFLAEYRREAAYNLGQWAGELERGEWYGAFSAAGKPVGLLGACREPALPEHERYLEYLWVHPDHRGAGVASRMVRAVLARLQTAKVRTVYLWVLDGNDGALRLYERLGFSSTGKKNDLGAIKPGRAEEQMSLDLG